MCDPMTLFEILVLHKFKYVNPMATILSPAAVTCCLLDLHKFKYVNSMASIYPLWL